MPRVRAGVLLAGNRAASSCMDLSDGLADGARQIADASNVGITIDADALPIASCVRRWQESLGRDPLEPALCGGDVEHAAHGQHTWIGRSDAGPHVDA